MRLTVFPRIVLFVVLFLSSDCNAENKKMLRKEMIAACSAGNIGRVMELSKEFSSLDFCEKLLPESFPESWSSGRGDSWTPLTAAIAGRHWVLSAYLIGRGASVNLTTGKGLSPIWYLAYHADHERSAIVLAELMLDRGSDTRVYSTAPGDAFYVDTALHRSVVELEVEITRLFLAHGADLDYKVNHQPSARTLFLEYYRTLKAVREKAPFDRTPDEWKRIDEMYNLLKSHGNEPKNSVD